MLSSADRPLLVVMFWAMLQQKQLEGERNSVCVRAQLMKNLIK